MVAAMKSNCEVRDMNYKVNINEEVKVKLTPFGIQVLKEQRDELNERIIGRGGKAIKDYAPSVDKDGYTKFQLWDLMNRFGDLMHLGSQIPFETTIIMMNGEVLDCEV